MENVRILNVVQASKYIKHGVMPVRLYVDKESDKLVFLFNKEETRELYIKWLMHELD